MSFSNDNSALENQLPVSVELPKESNGLRDAVNDLYQKIASTVNSKEGGLYVPIEKTTGQQYFSVSNPQKYRVVYRQVVNFGALPNSTSKSVFHNISGWNSSYRVTRMYGGATNPISLEGLPIPNDGILLLNNSTSVIVTTTSNRSSFTESTIVIEYTKEG